MNNPFYDKIEANPVIAAVNSIEKIDLAIKSPCEIVFLLTGNIFNLKGTIDKVKDNGMDIYVHIDLMEGFSKDMTALKYIYENMKPDGIITTKSSLVKAAKSMNIYAIQRLFILDSLSLERGINSINATKPDAIEILPGIMPKIIKKIYNETKLPVIGGGLINDKEDVIESLKAGAIGISTSKEEIWYM
ncbi:glycerol-3-phosphate responsive antiterminator [Crassaminicella thermophila]|uniref:Glycerol-3-phosphate responsive antiterminator n=1 Tax=Crassaminicella thermophila TaxID=2599308 RepID=A0A5C0SAD9_CRATE|nr:glycerol-3-phosphate responsive antiterminator [Crassaminicella thermophila]QEK10902.1 glycerol-3-phosphate responsive antiterminator [Crassaminicella thermophila]